ncbi:VOC family protein [Psychromarinibacter halotolerans]|uniref:VOC family protein n=1 Tax=Psychromarinibacter halotolerans TaxID=1775175 RepID=A0ABV7GW87_9RHOB|nr:VOC family protein [Psychromarinibacter halotolerans]MDF0597608.1 VOC family protein [Psychromarinibacter halotolerans]
MKAIRFNHLAVSTTDIEASVKFYMEVFGLEKLPTYNFGIPCQYLRMGEKQQLHIFQVPNENVPVRQHFAVDVDDFTAVYKKAKEAGYLDFEAFDNCMYELPDGGVQMYLRDPGGNLVEVDCPDVTKLDLAEIPDMKRLADKNPQTGENLQATLY